MKPALEGDDALNVSSANVSNYRQHADIWGVPGADGRSNPWGQGLDDTMFYL
jgi:hypothetical protein